MDENLRKLIFEACNDWAVSGMPVTTAIHDAFMESTGDRDKYPSALDSLAKLALAPEVRKSPMLCEAHGGCGFVSDCTECKTPAPNA